MRPESKPPDCPDAVTQLLPWYVNGTLSTADVRRVEAHLEQCAACRADLNEQRHLADLIRASAPVEYGPQAGWRKLQARVEAAGQAASQASTSHPGAWRSKSRPVAWLAAAVVVQSLALVALAGAGLLGWSTADMSPRYRTLTSTAAAGGTRLRVVFAPATTLGELNDLLRANQLMAIAGPSEAGLFTLAMQSSSVDQEALRIVLARLRADPRVRFADPLGADAVTR
jgi:anti-sigma factor RsiW